MLVSLTEKGKRVYRKHQQFHEELVQSIVAQLNDEEKVVLEKVLTNLNKYFKTLQEK